jgi:RNA polymerase sigma-70 factor, ECF subfamily
MKDPDEAQLTAACLAGDTDAFSVLVDRHRDAVFNLAYRLCGNAATAEDVAQEAFIRAYRKLRQYRTSLPFRNWVLGICANLSRSRYRSWRRKRDLEQAYAEAEAVARDVTPAEMDAETRAELERALTSLPPTLRAPIVLRYMEGMTVEEVAQALGLRKSATKMRLARGREHLETVLRAQGEGVEP